MTGWYALAFKGPSPRKLAAYLARVPAEMTPEAKFVVDAAVDALRNEHEMPNDTAALKRISAHEASFAKMMDIPRQDVRAVFISAIVERATREYLHARRDSEELMLVGAMV